jgi:hypothetical protein
MTAGARNPNHPVVRELEQQWHKLLGVVLHKYRDVLPNEVHITADDIQAFSDSGLANIVAHPSGDTIRIFLVTDEEATRLARKAGGLPI